MKKNYLRTFYTFVVFTFAAQFLYPQCQTTNWTNPSFEGSAAPHVLPAGWSNCNGTTSDTQPGSWGINTPPTNGSTWAGLVASGSWLETASQTFSPCLNAGQTYSFTIDILKVDETSDGGGDCDGHIELWGGDGSGSACDMDVLLWQTPNLVTNGPNQNNWITYTITFTPAQTICQLTFKAIQGNCASGTGDFYCGLDNISPIQPNITVTPSVLQNVSCFGGNNGSVTANVTAGGTAPFTYTWNPGAIPGQTASNLTAGTYSVTVVDGAGCSVTSPITVTEPPPVTITLTPTAANCGAGGSITTSVSGGSGSFTYSWLPSGGNVQNPTGLAPGNYSVTVTEPGCSYTASTTVGNSGGSIAAFTQSPDQCFAGHSFNFTNSDTTSGATFQWSFQSGTPSTSTNQVVNGVTFPAAGSYVVSFTITTGSCTGTATSTVTVFPDLSFTVSGTDTICPGGSAGWNVTANTAASYTWTPGNLSGTSQTLLPTATTAYTVIGSAGSCSDTATFSIVVAPTVTLSVGGFAATCAGNCDGQAVVLVSPTTGPFAQYSYAWTSSDTVPSVNNLCAGSYSVTVTDLAGCIYTSSVTVTEPTPVVASVSGVTNASCNGTCNGSALVSGAGGAGSGYSFSWTPSGAGSNPTNLCDGTYSVIVADANLCSDTVSFVIAEPTVITASITPVSIICIGQSANLNASANGGNGGFTYSWSAGTTPATGPAVTASPAITTTYTVTVTDVNLCPSATATVTVPVSSPLSVLASADVTICNTASTTLSAAATGGDGNYSYVWAPSPAPSGSSSSTVSPTVTTVYTVTVTDGCGTAPASDQVMVNVNPSPVINITATNPNGCAPWCVNFSGVSFPPSVSCNWTFTDGQTSNGNCSPNICFSDSGSYGTTLSVIDVNGCTNTLTQANIVNVYPNPDAQFTSGPQPTSELEPTVYFTDVSVGSNINSWFWEFGEVSGATSSSQNTEFTYFGPGTYNVSLTVTNTWGCIDSVTNTVYIEPDFSFYVPNAFSPNGDGFNDFFFTKGVGIDTTRFELWIFDRWGNQIWHTKDFFEKWDGRVLGKSEIVEIDVYVWKVKLQDFTTKKRQYVGHVTVVK